MIPIALPNEQVLNIHWAALVLPAIVLASIVCSALRESLMKLLKVPDEAPAAPAPDREEPAWMTRLRETCVRCVSRLFPSEQEQAGDADNGFGWTMFVALIAIVALDYYAIKLAVALIFPDDLNVLQVAATVGLIVLLITMAALGYDSTRPARRYRVAFWGLVVIITALGAYAGYWVGTASDYPVVMLIAFVAANAAFRLLSSVGAAWIGSIAMRRGIVQSMLVLFIAGCAYLIAAIALALRNWIATLPSLASLWRVVVLFLRGVTEVLADLGDWITHRPTIHLSRPVAREILGDALWVSGEVRHLKDVCPVLVTITTWEGARTLGTVKVDRKGRFEAELLVPDMGDTRRAILTVAARQLSRKVGLRRRPAPTSELADYPIFTI